MTSSKHTVPTLSLMTFSNYVQHLKDKVHLETTCQFSGSTTHVAKMRLFFSHSNLAQKLFQHTQPQVDPLILVFKKNNLPLINTIISVPNPQTSRFSNLVHNVIPLKAGCSYTDRYWPAPLMYECQKRSPEEHCTFLSNPLAAKNPGHLRMYDCLWREYQGIHSANDFYATVAHL